MNSKLVLKKNIIYPEFDTYGQTIYLPTYIPKGYIVDDINVKEGITTTRFVNDSKVLVFVQAKSAGLGVDIDKDDYDTQKMKIGDKTGYFSKERDETIFTYYEEDYSFTISGNLDKDEISKIVNSIEIYK